MDKALCLVAILLATVTATTARAAGGAVLAPEAALESFLESGSHTEAEIDAMAKAEVDALLGSDSETETEVDAEHDAEAEAEADVEAEGAMPRDTKAEEAAARRKARLAAKLAAANRKPVPPPRPNGRDPVRQALQNVEGADSEIVRLVYDELQRLGSVASVASPAAVASKPSLPGTISDPRIATLEHRLASFEKQRWASEDKQQSSAIQAINTRLAGLDKTLEALQKNSAEQQQLSSRLLKAVKAKQAKEDKGTPVDYSVEYVKEELPASFEKEAKAILDHFKVEARKIYERRCEKCKRTSNTPKTYPTEGGAAAAAAGAAGAAAAGGAEEAPGLPGAPAVKQVGTDPAAPLQQADADADPQAEAVRKAAAKKAAKKAVVNGKASKILFRPIINGKEPTPEGMRLSKALNHIALALPVTPAYQLTPQDKALQDVLGESAVNPNLKTPRL